MSKYRILFIMIFILLLTRIGALLFFMDDIYFDVTILPHGAIAKEIMEGSDLPLLEYPPTNYGHGGFLMGILTIPFFALFGKNLFALHLTPVMISAAILAVLFLFAYKYFNQRVAIITGLLYLFSSRNWVFFNIHAGGLHFENIIFTVSALYLFYEITFNRKENPVYFLSLGFICGVGTYWIYTFLVTLATILLLWFLRDKKMFLKKGIYIFWSGFLIAMIPWLIYNLQTHFKSITDCILDPLFFGKNYFGLRTWLGTIKRFLKVLVFSGMLSVSGRDRVFGVLYLLVYWLSFLSILRSFKYSLKKVIFLKESFLIVFPVLLFISNAFYSFYVNDLEASMCFIDWRYMVGIFPCIFLAVAIFIDRLIPKYRMAKPIFIAMFSFPVIFGVFAYSSQINLKNFGSGFKQPGYTYLYLSESFHCKYPSDFYKILDDITKLSAPEKYEVLTMPLAIYQEGKIVPVDFKEYLKLSERLDDKYKPVFYKILIKGLYFTSDLPLKGLVSQVDNFSKQVEDKYKPYLYQGVGALMVVRDLNDNDQYKDCADFIDKKYLFYYYRGLSDPFFCEDITDYIRRFKSCLGWLDKQYQPSYLEGVGEALAKIGVSFVIERVPCESVGGRISRDFYEHISPEYKKYILKGIGEGLSYFYSPNTENYIQQFLNTFEAKDRGVIFKTMHSNSSFKPSAEK